ncbi:MAG: hypothetical protein R3B55_03365 [Candidatus Paceibacterota bacterium]
MTSNNIHNLMSQMTTEQKSLWRIENHYIEEAGTAEERSFWEEMKEDKKAHIEELKELIKNTL